MAGPPLTEPFLPWGRAVIDAAAVLLESEIAGAWQSKPRRLRDREAVYVHFEDAHVPQPLAVWLYATPEGAAYNIRNYPDVIGVGLKYEADEELDRAVWKLRRLSLFVWHKHVDERWEGFRWMCRVGDLPRDRDAASQEIARRVLAALRRAGAISASQ